ncbi:hypothetical protein LZ190_13445 [Rhodovulum sulfidophilum]|nr:hypothetical protein [Rhodovulum sulfidophilum]
MWRLFGQCTEGDGTALQPLGAGEGGAGQQRLAVPRVRLGGNAGSLGLDTGDGSLGREPVGDLRGDGEDRCHQRLAFAIRASISPPPAEPMNRPSSASRQVPKP